MYVKMRVKIVVLSLPDKKMSNLIHLINESHEDKNKRKRKNDKNKQGCNRNCWKRKAEVIDI